MGRKGVPNKITSHYYIKVNELDLKKSFSFTLKLNLLYRKRGTCMVEILQTLANNILILLASLVLLGGLMLTNMILGAVMSATVGEFDKARFGRSIIKALLILLSVCVYYACLELMPILLTYVGIDVPEDLITTIEVLLIIAASFTKYAKEIFNKLLTLFDVTRIEKETIVEVKETDVEDIEHQVGAEDGDTDKG